MSIIGIRGFRRNRLNATLNPVVGTLTYSTSSQTHINCGFKPKYLIITKDLSASASSAMMIYSEDYSTSKFRIAGGSSYSADQNLGASANGLIYSIDNDGFTVNKVSSVYTMQYIAIPENYGGNVAIGTVNFSSTDSQSVNLGFKPEYLALTRTADASSPETDMHVYSEDYSTTKYRYAASSTYAKDQNFNTTEGARIYSIDSNGFTVNKRATGTKLQYIAVGRIPQAPKFPIIETSTYPTSGTKRIELGFKPAYLAITKSASSTSTSMQIFSRDYATDKFRDANGSTYAKDTNFGTTSDTRIFSIDDSGFTIDKFTSAQEFQYIAIPRDYKGRVKVGTITLSTSAQTHIDCGFKPKYLFTTKTASSASTNMMIYSEDYSTTQYRRAHSSSYTRDQAFEQAGNELLYSIDDDGFTINSASSAIEIQYIAIGEKGDISPHINGLKQTSVLYTGSAVTSEIDTDLVLGTDYTVEYSNNVNKGIATATIRGIGAYSGSVSFNYEVTDYTVGYSNFPSSGTTHINLGFKPAYLVVTRTTASATTADMIIYSKDYSTEKCRMAWSNGYAQDSALPNTNAERIASLDDTGFTVTNGVGRQFQYFAVPESYSGNVVVRDFEWNNSGNQSLEFGFMPSYFAITSPAGAPAGRRMFIYSKDYSTEKYRFASGGTYATDKNIGATGNDIILSMDATGVTLSKASEIANWQYIALGG